jgi:hypothetical protein
LVETFIQFRDMRHFYIVGNPPETRLGHALVLDSHDWSGFDYLRLMRGASIGSLPAGVSFRIKQNGPVRSDANVIVCPFGWKVVSSELANRLKAVAPADVELVEVAIANDDNASPKKRFFVINALRILNALSEQRTVRSSLALGDTKPVLALGVIAARIPEDVHVFRVIGDENRLIVDDMGKQALSSLPHDGLVFIPIEQE